MHRKVREVHTVEMFSLGAVHTFFINFLAEFKPDFLKRPGSQQRPI